MKNKIFINKIFIFCLCLSLSLSITGQENINSPNTVFGIGDIQLLEGGRSAGMALASMSLSGSYFLNTINPAGLAGIDSTNFIFDITLSARNSKYSYRGFSEEAFSANVTKIAAGLRFTRRWSGAFSIKPYSTVSYHIDKPVSKEGTEEKTIAEYEGSGGINQISLLNSYKVTDKLSFGADLKMLFGTINRNATLEGITFSKTSAVHTFAFSAGMLYKEKLTSRIDLSAALIYGSQNNFRFTNKLSVLDISGVSIYDDNIPSSIIRVPGNFGAGISIKGKQITIATDYYYRKKLIVPDNETSVKFADTRRLSFGVALTPGNNYSASYIAAIEYQAGFAVSNSYLIQNGINPLNLEFSAGAGLPLRGGSQVNLAFHWGRRGVENSGIIREDYFRLSLGYSFVERMFFRRLYD